MPTPPAASRSDAQDWHARPADAVLVELGSAVEGLTDAEATLRLQRYGANELPAARRKSALRRFFAQFNNLLLYVLIGAGAIVAMLGHFIDTAVIIAVVVINAIIGFIQEDRAERALLAIRSLLAPQATVLRGGRRRALAARELVPGDIVVVQPGDLVPADLRLLRCNALRVQEAALTGESMPVDKHTDAVAAATVLAERGCMTYAGTLVAAGNGVGIVVATGLHTEVGRISALVSAVEPLQTPLARQMGAFARRLAVGTLGLALLTLVFGVLVHRFAVADMFMAAVALAVAVIPEGLPAIVTITLAIGVQRMARRRAIIRHLPSVESLGSVGVICSDKTGTFTYNEMTVQSLWLATGDCVRAQDDPWRQVLADPAAARLTRFVAHGAVLCNDAEPATAGTSGPAQGDPLEGALLDFAGHLGLDPGQPRGQWPRIAEHPFASESRYMASLHRDAGGAHALWVKGAPERVLAMCDALETADGPAPLDRASWLAHAEAMAARGEKVIALAHRRIDGNGADALSREPERLALAALIGLADPPRPDAVAAVARCRGAGIRVKMITGDHAVTATAIAQRVGLDEPQRVVTGSELDSMPDDRWAQCAKEVNVFARTTPEQKQRLVSELQKSGAVVAMTGDGVNDAPALRRADIGIAMGKRGTDAARGAAVMVLADDNFASIADAVEEGRTVYDNLRKAILFILPTNGGEALMVMAAVALGMVLPITALQILWVNLVTSIALDIALAFEPAESDVMRRPPRDPAEPLLTGLLVWRLFYVSMVMFGGVLAVFSALQHAGADLDTARAAAVSTLVLFEIAYLFSVRRLASPGWDGLFTRGATPLWIAVGGVLTLQLAFVYLPPLQHSFGTAPLQPWHWLLVTAVAATLTLIVELEKAWLNRRNGAGCAGRAASVR